MNANPAIPSIEGPVATANAFAAGSELWIIENNPNLAMWHSIDFATCSLLTENNLHTKTEPSAELTQILEATRLETKLKYTPNAFVLLGTSNHFRNKWTLVYARTQPDQVAAEIEKLAATLKFSSLRLFSDSQPILKQLKARPTASRLTISFIENT